MRRIMAAVCAASAGILVLVLLFAVKEYKSIGTEEAYGEISVQEAQTPTGLAGMAETTETAGEALPAVILPYQTETELLFAGDICLQDYIAGYFDGDGIQGIVSEELQDCMRKADIMMANQEFAFSERGTAMEDKEYTFRIAPRYTAIFTELGIDIVTLANNHALDYGTEALLDSFDALDQAGIRYVGAGENLERARRLEVIESNGMKIGYLAASRVIPVHSWNAGSASPGMLTTYDPALLLEAIEEGKKRCDVLIVYVHWGEERTEYPEEYQRTMAKQYIDAGADAVIGSHPHVMQGIEVYKGKLIAYSLGNYIFSARTGTGALLKMVFHPDGTQEAGLVAFDASAFPVTALADGKKGGFFDYMESISFGISIDEAGRICYTQDKSNTLAAAAR